MGMMPLVDPEFDEGSVTEEDDCTVVPCEVAIGSTLLLPTVVEVLCPSVVVL